MGSCHASTIFIELINFYPNLVFIFLLFLSIVLPKASFTYLKMFQFGFIEKVTLL